MLTLMEQSWTTLLSVVWTNDASGPLSSFSTFSGWTCSELDRTVLFHCEGGWNDVLGDMKTLFLLETVMLASFRVSGKNVMVPSFGNLAFDEVKSFLLLEIQWFNGRRRLH